MNRTASVCIYSRLEGTDFHLPFVCLLFAFVCWSIISAHMMSLNKNRSVSKVWKVCSVLMGLLIRHILFCEYFYDKCFLNLKLEFCFLYLFFFLFLGPHLQHVEIPRQGVESEL